MVQTDISQLSAECAEWRQVLRGYRDEFQSSQTALLETSRMPLPKDQLPQVEHFQNQFDIQLQNIHNLKQRIKFHERSVNANETDGDIYARHESLLSEFLDLEGRLQDLRDEFASFVTSTNCV